MSGDREPLAELFAASPVNDADAASYAEDALDAAVPVAARYAFRRACWAWSVAVEMVAAPPPSDFEVPAAAQAYFDQVRGFASGLEEWLRERAPLEPASQPPANAWRVVGGQFAADLLTAAVTRGLIAGGAEYEPEGIHGALSLLGLRQGAEFRAVEVAVERLAERWIRLFLLNSHEQRDPGAGNVFAADLWRAIAGTLHTLGPGKPCADHLRALGLIDAEGDYGRLLGGVAELVKLYVLHAAASEGDR